MTDTCLATESAAAARKARGHRNYRKGAGAEDAVVRHLRRSGMAILARRWRGRAGELDIVARDAAGFVVVEVKSARNWDDAAAALSQHQARRIADAAAEFIGDQPDGLLSDIRIDLALVDQIGRIDIVENAIWH